MMLQDDKQKFEQEIKDLEKIIDNKDSTKKEKAEAYKKILTIYPEVSDEMYPVMAFIKETPYGKPKANRKKSRKPLEMGGLLENDETRIGYATGEEVVDPMQEAINNLKNFLNEKEIKDVQNNTITSPIVRKYINKVEEQGAEPGAVLAMFTPVVKKEEPRVQKAEGDSIDDQMMMVMTPPMESEMEPDGEMEDGYTRFIMDEALTEEEEDMLMSKLEQDEELAMIFDKVIDVAQEFAGAGPIEGPGSGVSDSIPARLSDGEFVFTAKAVEEIGADNLMAMMKDAEAKADERQGLAMGGSPEENESKSLLSSGIVQEDEVAEDELKKRMVQGSSDYVRS